MGPARMGAHLPAQMKRERRSDGALRGPRGEKQTGGRAPRAKDGRRGRALRVGVDLERLEEDLTDMITMPRRFKLVIDVLDAVEIPAEKLPRGAENDPVMDEVRDRLEANLALSAEWMPVYEPELEG